MNVEQLIEVLSLQSASFKQWRVFAYLIRKAKAAGATYYTNEGNIYITKGNADSFPCVVAHMDTVHKIESDFQVYDIAGNLIAFNRKTVRQVGVGGDDKVGLFIALQCLEHFDNIKIAFFRDEEVGCHGSYLADSQFFEDVGYVLQCDRRGYGDFITNASGIKLSSKSFQKRIKPILAGYGYKFEQGAMTDVMALKENGINVSMANMSCGYYNPHSASEYVNIEDVKLCLRMVQELIEELGEVTFAHQARVPSYSKGYSGGSSGFNQWSWNDYNKKDESKGTHKGMTVDQYLEKYPPKQSFDYCECCGEEKPWGYVQFNVSYNIDMCYDCYTQYDNSGRWHGKAPAKPKQVPSVKLNGKEITTGKTGGSSAVRKRNNLPDDDLLW